MTQLTQSVGGHHASPATRHRRVLVRSRKDPFDALSPEATLDANTIAKNAGNLIFSHAVHRMLGTDRTEVTSNGFVGEHHGERRWAGEINERYDVFVVPLANAFRRSFDAKLANLTGLIERLKIPVVVLGVGSQSNLNYDSAMLKPIDDTVRRFVKAVLDRSPSIGVRGEFTQRYLRELGFRDVEVIGCPSMFMNGNHMRIEKTLPELTPAARVAINISPYVMAMGEVVMSNHARYPHLTYIAQDLKSLETLLWGDRPEDAGKTSSIPIYTSHPLYRENKVRFFVDPPTWISFLAELDFSFGTRIHGNITALIAGTPAYVLAHDSRTLELAEYFQIPHKRMPDVRPDLDPAELYAEADYSGLNSGHAERFDRFVGYLDKHGLDHIFRYEAGGSAFDEKVRATAYAPGVQAAVCAPPDVLVGKMRSLKERNDQLRRKVVTLRNRAPARLAERAWRRLRGISSHHLGRIPGQTRDG